MGGFFLSFCMRYLVFLILSVLWGSGAVALAESPSVSSGAARRHVSSLKFENGSYTSIFGLVPKKYSLESQESREILQKTVDERHFSLELVASQTRRILSIPEEAPLIETLPKPLTGSTVQVTQQGETWEFEVPGRPELTEDEMKEARRLVARYQPGASPLVGITWGPEGAGTLDLQKLLTFLGYTQLSEVSGEAKVQKSGVAAGADDPFTVEVKAAFRSGEGSSQLSVELEAKGTAVVTPGGDAKQGLMLQGRLVLHGQRDLSDGRRVPYSLETDFRYETQSAVPPAGS